MYNYQVTTDHNQNITYWSLQDYLFLAKYIPPGSEKKIEKNEEFQIASSRFWYFHG